ncbi:MAG: bifunctional glutamate N-acetyltransferase/amino-acid acetyltransferase ArgJ [Clostridia bacterium]
MEHINGGITAPKGFKANGIHCGIRKNRSKRDLALIISDAICNAASVYTTNLVKGAPLVVTKRNLEDGKAQAVICNSGNANTCNANGIEIANSMCSLVSEYTGIKMNDVIVASTGVIGQPMSIDPIKNGMAALCEGLTSDGSAYASEAIMTTDTRVKEIAVRFTVGGHVCTMGGIAKGSGMIHPDMATMLVFITTDTAISSKMLKIALSDNIQDTFHMISVDGDTSTNDMVSVLANGIAGNDEINENNADYRIFYEALNEVMMYLCRMIAKDGEGATKLITCDVIHGKDKDTCRTVAKSVICSSLLKAAMFGCDANWGRVLCAIGYSKCDVDVNKIDVSFASKAGSIDVCKNGAGVGFSEADAKTILKQEDITIKIDLNAGAFFACAYGCDLTYDYVKINGDYRT